MRWRGLFLPQHAGARRIFNLNTFCGWILAIKFSGLSARFSLGFPKFPQTSLKFPQNPQKIHKCPLIVSIFTFALFSRFQNPYFSATSNVCLGEIKIVVIATDPASSHDVVVTPATFNNGTTIMQFITKRYEHRRLAFLFNGIQQSALIQTRGTEYTITGTKQYF